MNINTSASTSPETDFHFPSWCPWILDRIVLASFRVLMYIQLVCVARCLFSLYDV